MRGNILDVFGDNSSKLPLIFYKSVTIFPDKSKGTINKLFLFVNKTFHNIYKISSIFPEDHETGNQNITGYFYDSMFSNVNSFNNFDIICRNNATKLLIKGATIKRNSGGSIFNYHSFYALSFDYLK